MGKYQFIYFPVRGRGEAIRFLLIENGIEHEEVEIQFKRWREDFKPEMPFGQVPCLKKDDLVLVQSNAILRHMARKYGLYGSNDEEATRIDMINDQTEDVRVNYTRMIYKNYEEGKDEFIQSLPSQLKYIENYLVKHGDVKLGFSVGNKRNFADYNLTDLLDALKTLSPTCLDAFPGLVSYFEANCSHPKIAAYRQTEAFKNRPFNGNGKQ